MAPYSAARADLRRGIREAKLDYKRKIENHLSNNNSRQVWQGIQQLTNYRGTDITSEETRASLAEELNIFFSCFEALPQQSSPKPAQFHPAPSSKPLTVQVREVEQVLSRVNNRKAQDLIACLGRS